MVRIFLLVVLSTSFLLGNLLGGPRRNEESPKEGLVQIVELYKAKDWDSLVRTRCVEAQIAKSDAEILEYVSTLNAQFSQSGAIEAIVSHYETALTSTPEIYAGGTVAVFTCEFGSVRLSKMESGKWGLEF